MKLRAKKCSHYLRKLFQPNSFGGNVLLKGGLQIDAIYSNFENFESFLYLKSVSMPLRKPTAAKPPILCAASHFATKCATGEGNKIRFIIPTVWTHNRFSVRCSGCLYVTCYHKMSVKSPVYIQRNSLLNMSQNNRKQRKINTNYWFLVDKTRSYTHISYIILKLVLWEIWICNNFE